MDWMFWKLWMFWRAGGLEKPELPEKTELLVKKWNKHG